MAEEHTEETQEELDYKTEYEALKAKEEEWQTARQEAEEIRQERDQWNKWWEVNAAPFYDDPEKFTKDVRSMANGDYAKRVREEVEQTYAERQANTARSAQTEESSRALEGTEDDDYIKASYVRAALDKQAQDFNSAVNKLAQNMNGQIVGYVQNTLLPNALSMYDSTRQLMSEHASDEGFDISQITQYMAQNNIRDPHTAWQALYGEAAHQAEIEMAKTAAKEEAMKEYAKQQASESVKVATGYPVPKLGTKPLGKAAGGWDKEALFNELMEKGAIRPS